MTDVTYEIVEHDGGWAYKAQGTYSETFATHDEALSAARRAAREQELPGAETGIEYEDEQGRWHGEVSAGDDRPETHVDDHKRRH
jgi:hypothetical protein